MCWRTNSHGHISDWEYPTSKPPNESPIAVVGDSFAARIMTSIRWPDVLEQELGLSKEWNRYVGGKQTRAINLSRDGVGIVQFPRLLSCEAEAFQPDVIIASFIADDIVKKPVPPSASTPDISHATQVEQLVKQKILDEMPFWRPYPELLAVTFGAGLGLKPRLEPADLRYYPDDADGVRESVRALTAIRKKFGSGGVRASSDG